MPPRHSLPIPLRIGWVVTVRRPTYFWSAGRRRVVLVPGRLCVIAPPRRPGRVTLSVTEAGVVYLADTGPQWVRFWMTGWKPPR